MRVLIRTTTTPPEEFGHAFPHLTPDDCTASTTLVGHLDGEEFRAVLDRLHLMGIDVTEVVTVPDV